MDKSPRNTAIHLENDLPRITIVTPSFNQGEFLEDTILSVLNQAYPNLEYIIIDGGSSDGSVEIIKRFADDLSYWTSEKDNGQSSAINKGWQRATGEILCWLNSDDYLLPGTLLRVAEIFKIHPDAGFIHANAIRIDQAGQPSGEPLGGQFDLHASLVQSKNPVAQPTTFITRKALDEVGLLDENLHMSMDWDLWIRIAALYPVYYFNENWAAFRVWPGAKGSIIVDTSSPDHLRSVKKLIFHGKSRKIPLSVKRKALATNYSRDAVYRFKIGDKGLFRWHLFLSLCLSPCLQERYGRDLIPELFLGSTLSRYLIKIKQRLKSQV